MPHWSTLPLASAHIPDAQLHHLDHHCPAVGSENNSGLESLDL